MAEDQLAGARLAARGGELVRECFYLDPLSAIASGSANPVSGCLLWDTSFWASAGACPSSARDLWAPGCTIRPAFGWGGAPGVRQPLQEWCSCRAPAVARPVGWDGALGARRKVGASCAPGLRILVRARGRRVLRIAALWLSTGTTRGLIPQWCSWPSTARVVLWVPLREWCHCRAPAVARPVGYGGALGARQDAEPL